MANVLQDYFDRLTAVNRQRGMTGNMQYGRGMDASLAEGYFDAYNKNKNTSQDLALRKEALDANTAYQQGSLANQAETNTWQRDVYNKALGQQNTWQAIGAVGQLAGIGAGAYFKQQALDGTKTAIDKPYATDTSGVKYYEPLSSVEDQPYGIDTYGTKYFNEGQDQYDTAPSEPWYSGGIFSFLGL